MGSNKFSALLWLGRQLSSLFVLAALPFCMLLKSNMGHSSWKCSFFQRNSENFFLSAFTLTVFISRWNLIEEIFLFLLKSQLHPCCYSAIASLICLWLINVKHTIWTDHASVLPMITGRLRKYFRLKFVYISGIPDDLEF